MSLKMMLILCLILISCSYKIFVAGGSYCLFLVLLSVVSSLILMINSLSFWYCILMLLVYVGGVYMLLLFVSMYSYNSVSYSNFISMLMYLVVSSFYLTLSDSCWSPDSWFNLMELVSFKDESKSLISYKNWVSYIFILSVMMMSLMMFSFIFSSNPSYMR